MQYSHWEIWYLYFCGLSAFFSLEALKISVLDYLNYYDNRYKCWAFTFPFKTICAFFIFSTEDPLNCSFKYFFFLNNFFLSSYMYAMGNDTFLFIILISRLIPCFVILSIFTCAFFKVLLELTPGTNFFPYSSLFSLCHIWYYLYQYLQTVLLIWHLCLLHNFMPCL